MSNMSVSIIDNDNESSKFALSIPQLDAAGYVATMANVDAIVTALGAVTLGAIKAETVTATTVTHDPSRPTDPYANRETGVIFYMVSDTTGQKMRVTLPAPNLSLFPFSTLGVGRVQTPWPVALSAGVQALIDAIEAGAVYEQDDGGVETVTVYAMEHVGRNL